MDEDYIDICSIDDYRLNGHPVKFVLKFVDQRVEFLNEFFPTIPILKGIFYNFLRLFKLEKDFCCYAKDHKGSEEELYIPYVKTFMFELKEDLHKCARIFETEEEDRTNKRHRKCIQNMLPIIRDFGSFYVYFFYRFYSAKNHNKIFRKEERNDFQAYNSSFVKKGNDIYHNDKKGWRQQHKRK